MQQQLVNWGLPESELRWHVNALQVGTSDMSAAHIGGVFIRARTTLF